MIVDPATWKQVVCADGCQIHDSHTDCEPPLQAAHVVSQQALKRRGLHAHLWDTRNGIGACYKAHRRSDNAVERFPADRIPVSAWEFADELGLGWWMERIYGDRPTLDVVLARVRGEVDAARERAGLPPWEDAA